VPNVPVRSDVKVLSDFSLISFIVTVPENYSLNQNYPNPFNPTTIIEYNLPKDSKIILEVYDILGCRVVQLFSGLKRAGSHRISWNGKDEDNTLLASGVYIIRMRANYFTDTKKIMFIK